MEEDGGAENYGIKDGVVWLVMQTESVWSHETNENCFSFDSSAC